MQIELTSDAAQWVRAALAAGRFGTAEDAVRYAIKRAALAEMLVASETEGGSFSAAEARQHVQGRAAPPRLSGTQE